MLVIVISELTQNQGVDRNPGLKNLSDEDLVKVIEGKMWVP
jgi:hypothetical protein